MLPCIAFIILFVFNSWVMEKALLAMGVAPESLYYRGTRLRAKWGFLTAWGALFLSVLQYSVFSGLETALAMTVGDIGSFFAGPGGMAFFCVALLAGVAYVKHTMLR